MKDTGEAVIDIRGLTKDYGQGRGVFDVTLSVRAGEVMGFLGPNGAGKTTTIRHLMGFIRPQRGSVSILGMDCFTCASRIQAHLGYLPGEIALMDDLRAADFVRFVAQMKGVRDLTRTRQLMERFELSHQGRIKKMSKGMKQKLAIVCAFMNDAQVYLLDEPTSGLDPLMQVRFVELIREEQAAGKTILLSSHQFDEIERTCERAIIIRQGRIAAVEQIESLKRNRSKRFEIIFDTPQTASAFAGAFPGASAQEERAYVKIKGDADALMKCLANYHVRDIDVRTQTLEELFMHYYGGDRA